MPPCPNFSTLAIKLVHSARTKVTFFCISVHLVSQYLSLFVYKFRHCMPRMPALCVLIKFNSMVPAGLEWKKKKKEKNGLKIVWLPLERGLLPAWFTERSERQGGRPAD